MVVVKDAQLDENCSPMQGSGYYISCNNNGEFYRKGSGCCNQDGTCEEDSGMFGEVLFLASGDGYRSLPYNNSLDCNFCGSVYGCVCACVHTCICTFSVFAFVCGAEEKLNRGHSGTHSRLLSVNTR